MVDRCLVVDKIEWIEKKGVQSTMTRRNVGKSEGEGRIDDFRDMVVGTGVKVRGGGVVAWH